MIIFVQNKNFMYKIEYDIRVDDNGRAYIHLFDDYENKPEDKFLVIEFARYVLLTAFNNNNNLGDETNELANNVVDFMTEISDEMSNILVDSMKNLGDFDKLMNRPYNIYMKTKKELDDLTTKYITNKGRLFEKEDGLKAFVENENKIYVLNNNDWIEND